MRVRLDKRGPSSWSIPSSPTQPVGRQAKVAAALTTGRALPAGLPLVPLFNTWGRRGVLAPVADTKGVGTRELWTLRVDPGAIEPGRTGSIQGDAASSLATPGSFWLLKILVLKLTPRFGGCWVGGRHGDDGDAWDAGALRANISNASSSAVTDVFLRANKRLLVRRVTGAMTGAHEAMVPVR
jgi:hypothetical protein